MSNAIMIKSVDMMYGRKAYTPEMYVLAVVIAGIKALFCVTSGRKSTK